MVAPLGLGARRDPVPLYFQLKQILIDMIENEELRPGECIPSERELSEKYQISRMTVRQAITELVHEGLLYRQQGRGTFVAEPKIEQGLFTLTSFTEDMLQRGLKPETRLLESAVINAPRKVERVLELSMDRRVLQIRRLRLADGEPMALETSHLAYNLCKSMADEELSGSLYRLLEEKYGLTLGRARQTLEPVLANPDEAEMLGTGPGAPLLLLQRVTYLASGKPLELVKAVYRGDRYKFTVELHRRSER